MKNFKRYEIGFGIIRRETNGDDSRAEGVYRKEESEEMRKNALGFPFRFRSHREFPRFQACGYKFYTITIDACRKRESI